MEYLIILVAGLAVYHFVWESILAPHLRFHIRLRLFAIRDELRAVKHEHRDELGDDTFSALHDAINSSIKFCPAVSLSVQRDFEALLERNPELKEVINERVGCIESSTIDKVGSLWHQVKRLSFESLLINTGGWFVYIVPIALAYAATERISKMATNAITLPLSKLEEILSESLGEESGQISWA